MGEVFSELVGQDRAVETLRRAVDEREPVIDTRRVTHHGLDTLTRRDVRNQLFRGLGAAIVSRWADHVQAAVTQRADIGDRVGIGADQQPGARGRQYGVAGVMTAIRDSGTQCRRAVHQIAA